MNEFGFGSSKGQEAKHLPPGATINARRLADGSWMGLLHADGLAVQAESRGLTGLVTKLARKWLAEHAADPPPTMTPCHDDEPGGETTMTLDEARESLATLEEIERFLIEDVGGGGRLTLATALCWAEQVADCREKIRDQKAWIARLEALRIARPRR